MNGVITLKIPESMEDLVYWTSRSMGDGRVKAWVQRENCPKCNEALMGKPRGDKGNVKIRASYFECPKCHHKVEKKEYEETLTVNIIYTCPKCKHQGDAQTPFKRKKYNGVDSVVFSCTKCQEKIPITKKMKEA